MIYFKAVVPAHKTEHYTHMTQEQTIYSKRARCSSSEEEGYDVPPLGRVRRAEGILVPARAGDGAAREVGSHAWLGVRVRCYG